MTTNETFGALLEEWLRDDAAHRVADHLSEVLVTTRATQQRRWWSSPERWLPMEIPLQAHTIAPRGLGRVLVVAAVVVALLGVAIWFTGSPSRRLPPPFGPAANGTILSWDPGDIYVSAADGTARRLLVGGDTNDFAPAHSRNGTEFVFLRLVGPDASLPMLANADGSGITPLLDAPLVNPNWYEWSPTDDRLAIVHVVGDRRVLSIVTVGSRARQEVPLPAGFVPDFDVQWRAPDGRELILTEQGTDTHGGGIYAVHPDGTGFREILPAPAKDGYFGLTLAPDGRTAAYWTSDPSAPVGSVDGPHSHVHFVDLDSGFERRVVFEGQDVDETDFAYSPDGTTGLVVVGDPGGGHVLLVHLDGAAPPRRIGAGLAGTRDRTIGFSPDGKTVVIHIDAGRPTFIDVTTGAARTASDVMGRIATWQRLAP